MAEKNENFVLRPYIIILIILLLFIVGGSFWFFNFKNKKTVDLNKNEVSNLTAAKSSLDWINSQKQTNLSYSDISKCLKNECAGEAFNYRVIPYIVWGKYFYYLKTGDESVLTSLDADLDQINGNQYTAWNCKLLYDIYQKTDSESLKLKLKSGCINGSYEVFLKGKYLSSANLNSELKKNIDNLILENFEINIDEIQKKGLITEFNRYIYYVSEVSYNELMGIKIPITNDNKDEAKQAYNLAIKGYLLMGNEASIQKSLLLGIASIDLYKITNDTQYIRVADLIYNKLKNNPISSIGDFTYKYIFLKDFSEVIKKDLLSESNFQENISSIKKEFFNSNLGAFGSDNVYSTSNNALIIGILSQ